MIGRAKILIIACAMCSLASIVVTDASQGFVLLPTTAADQASAIKNQDAPVFGVMDFVPSTSQLQLALKQTALFSYATDFAPSDKRLLPPGTPHFKLNWNKMGFKSPVETRTVTVENTGEEGKPSSLLVAEEPIGGGYITVPAGEAKTCREMTYEAAGNANSTCSMTVTYNKASNIGCPFAKLTILVQPGTAPENTVTFYG